jgi:hypothetical protein
VKPAAWVSHQSQSMFTDIGIFPANDAFAATGSGSGLKHDEK